MTLGQIIWLVICCITCLIVGFLAGRKSMPIIGDLVDTGEGFYLSFDGSDAINETKQKKVVSVRCKQVEQEENNE